MKKRFSISTVSILFFIALFLGMQLNNLISGDNIFDQLNKFKDVLSLAEKYYVDDVDSQKLVESAINGMMDALDPHSIYIPASQLPKINEEFHGAFEGIGVEYDIINDTLLVVSPIPGGPSEALGILAGDKIVKIDDSSSVGIKREHVPRKLRGPKGTHVKVTVFRPGDKELIEFDIIRDKIPIYSVDVSYMIDTEIGYVSVNRFSETTHDEFVEAVAKLKSQGMKRLILDLRNNPGGLLVPAYQIADELLSKGKKIVYTKGRKPEFNEEYASTGNGKFMNLPIIILINHGSASSSEILTGAVQDWDRGLIVGETSFGKGLVQRQWELPDKSAFRLTIARYYTPSGRLIQRPYGSDRDAYRSAAFNRNEDEGENIEHTEEGDSTRPVFKTSSGRKVFGGGGITPDYILKSDTLTRLSIQLIGRGVVFEYVTSYLDRFGKALREQYEKDMNKFESDFVTTDDMLKECIDIAKKKSIAIDSDQYKRDQRYIKARIKAQIARAIWGNVGWFSIIRSEDNQLQKAVSLFPEAEKIAGIR
jgi:carboxyl-terminal processing protease